MSGRGTLEMISVSGGGCKYKRGRGCEGCRSNGVSV